MRGGSACRSSRSSTSTATPAGTSAARSSPSGGWSTTCAATSAELLAKAIDQHALDRQCPEGRAGDDPRSSSALTRSSTPTGATRRGGSSGFAVERAAATTRRRCRCRRSASRSCCRRGAVGLALHVRAYLGHAGDDAPAGRRHGSHRPCHLRAGEAAVRLNTPVTAIRRVGDRVRIEHGPGSR